RDRSGQSAMKIFFYVQHLLGIGHLKRAGVLTAALRKAGCEVTLVSGGVPVRGIDVDWKRLRAGALLDAWRAARADVLLVELFPFGRRQMRFELLPLLEDAQRLAPRPLVVCSVRDLLQPRPEREADTT